MSELRRHIMMQQVQYGTPLPTDYYGDVEFEIWKENGLSQFLANGVAGGIFAYDSSAELPLTYIAFLPNASGKVYPIQVASRRGGSADVLNLIPCKRISDNAVGLYDTIAQLFHEGNSASWQAATVV